MSKSSARSAIRLRGVRHNNLKNFALDLPLKQLIVVTGLSGSGKSSLAFDTLFAEGQRRYIETFSPYARQFLDRMDKPQVDSIEGIPPAIAIEQRNSVRTTRSTVGTMTEICDYMKMLWPHIAHLHCRQCTRPVHKEPPQFIWEALHEISKQHDAPPELLVTFDLPLSEKLPLEESLGLISKQGYQRLLLNGQMLRLDEAASRLKSVSPSPNCLTVIQDRLRLACPARPRFIEACEQAYHFGKGKLTIWSIQPQGPAGSPTRFSDRLHCAQCDIDYKEPSSALFSFNHPLGACPTCRGFGRIISIDYDLAIPDRSKTLAQGAVKPWQSGQSAECQTDMLRMCRAQKVPIDVPFDQLSKKWQSWVVDGEPGYGKDPAHQWPHAWYGIKGYFRWLESKAYKMHVRVLLARYRTYTPCPDCRGRRFQPDALLYTVDLPHTPSEGRTNGANGSAALTLADFYQLPIRDALRFIAELKKARPTAANDPLGLILNELHARLGYLDEVGLGYLTLDRPTRSLSGGETERVNLTTCLGTRLVNTLFVLDEPTVGLHARDTQRLVRIMQGLRDAGNTVVVVEHEASVMRAADQIIDLGPGHGATGGQVVFQGPYEALLKSKQSLTAQYLSGRKTVDSPPSRPVTLESGSSQTKPKKTERRSSLAALELNDATIPYGARQGSTSLLTISHATRNNLKDLSVQIPLGRFVCISGVSGSGKSTLVREVLLPLLSERLKSPTLVTKASDRMEASADESDSDEPTASAFVSASLRGAEHLGNVVLVDQSILGKTPRSNPAVYIGAFEDIREFFAQSEVAKQRGMNASAFSFNSAQGQCERCRGAGFEKIEMQFLSDVFIRCPDCNGRRYRAHILDLKVSPSGMFHSGSPLPALSIADLLESTVEEAIEFLRKFPGSRPARRAVASLTLLQEVGLGYLKLGQPINTLSGGESQRLKLVRHLAESDPASNAASANGSIKSAIGSKKNNESIPLPTLFLFDEPTTGLHFDDVRVLLKVFQRLVNAGHSVLVIEHNLDVIKSADWVLDLGPEAGDQGGRIVAQGTPEQLVACPESRTGAALREGLMPLSRGRGALASPQITRR